MTEKKKLQTGNPCPGCLISDIFLGQSIPKEELGVRVKYWYCSDKCGWSQKEVINLDDAPRQVRPNPNRFIRKKKPND